MNEIKVFKNDAFGAIRTVGTSEEPLFCLADVCTVLDLQPAAVMRRLDGGVISSHPISDNLGRTQQANFVNEDGLYDVIFDSRKPEAKAFRKWVTSEVLPSIRKTGEYVVPAKKEIDSKSLFQKMRVASWTAKFLNLNEASRLGMARMIAASVGMEETLPTAVDAGTEHPTVHSATDQLKRFGIDMSACAFNKLLLRKGVVKQESRQGSGGKVHRWMVLLPKYNQYGENQRDPQHQQQTSIKWYDNLFPRLLSEVGINYIRKEA
jgi:prophage antirepressor-like protein